MPTITEKHTLPVWLLGRFERYGQSTWFRHLPYWVAAILTGLFAVGYAKLYNATANCMFQFAARHFYLFVASAPGFFLVGWWLVHRFAPSAGGSGIPQVMAAVENQQTANAALFSKSLLSVRIIPVKILSSLACLMGGGAIGREGPMIQISASLFSFIDRHFGEVTKATNPITWISAGAAAGIAAAFNTPLGGIVFAVEELASTSLKQFKMPLIASVIIAGTVAQWLLGPYLFLGFFRVAPMAWHAVTCLTAVSLICGLAGGLFGRLLSKAVERTSSLSLPRKALFAAMCGLVVALIGVIGPDWVYGNGVPTIEKMLTEPTHVAAWQHSIGRYASKFISYISGCAGGIFSPALSIGAAFGGAIDGILNSGNLPLMIMVGMTAFLTALTHAPFTSFILVLEMTDRHSVVFPIMLSAMLGYAASHIVDPESFYHRQMKVYLKQLT